MDDWLIIDKIEDVLVNGTSIPYNYEKSKFKNNRLCEIIYIK